VPSAATSGKPGGFGQTRACLRAFRRRRGQNPPMDHVSELTVPPATAWAELTSESFLRDLADEIGVEVRELTCGREGERATAAMQWTFQTDRPGIPELAKKFLPSNVNLSWGQWWEPLADDEAQGHIDVVLTGRPSATATGSCRLVATVSGSLLTTSTRTKADLPFPVAGRVESMIDKELIGWIISLQARVLMRRSMV
jgi:hypothetical protein